MEKKRILHIVESFGGGVFSFLVDLINYIDKDFDVTVAYGVREETPKDFENYFNDRVSFVKVGNFTRAINLPKDYKAFKEIKKIVKEINPDVVHLHSSKAGFIGRFAINGRKTRVIYNPHGFSFLKLDDSKLKRFIYRFLEKIAAFNKSIIVGCSEGEYKEAFKLSKNSVCINNGTDIDKLRNETQNLKEKNFNKNNLKICTVGRINYQKNPEMFNKIAEAFPKLQFTWIGDGDLKNKLTASNIKITGWIKREEVLKELNNNEVFILTSLWEGLPISLLESMFMKKLCIVSNCIGNRDVIINQVNGFVCDNLKTYEKVINEIIKGNIDTNDIIEKSYKNILKDFNSENMAEEYVELYR